MKQARAERELTLVVTEEMPWGFAVLGWDGRVVFMNSKARAIVERRDGLKLENGQLAAVQGAEYRTLGKLIAKALKLAQEGGAGPHGALSVTRSVGKKPLAIEISPHPHISNPDSAYAVLVHIIDPEEKKSVDHAALASIFSLSKREAELAEHLGVGRSLEDAAERMGITHNTVRNHLHNVFLKTDTHNQIDLARLLAHLPPQS